MRTLEQKLQVTAEVLAAVSAVAAASFLAIGPVYRTTRVTSSGSRIAEASTSLAAQNGPWVYGLLTIVVLIAAAPLLARVLISRRLPGLAHTVRTAAVVILGAFVVIAGFSIGLFFAPAAFFGLVSLSPTGEPDGAAAA